ncbi:MAG: DinB family protein [Dehalococcoidia bacterium]
MADTDPIIAAARDMYTVSVKDLRSSLEGLGADGLNWKPEAPETNSVSVLASHALGACRAWFCMAVDAPMPDRSREAEFLSEFSSEEKALAFVDAIGADSLRILDEATALDWGDMRPMNSQPGAPMISRAYTIMHAVEHLREHVAHLQLTRQLWDASKS